MTVPTKEQISIFIDKSISNKQYNDDLIFKLSKSSIDRINKILSLNLFNYTCLISSHSIRHINKKHKEDLKYICEIVNILDNFYQVKKSLTRCNKTGATLVSLEFYKKFENNIIKLIKLKVHRERRLELKTLFIKQ